AFRLTQLSRESEEASGILDEKSTRSRWIETLALTAGVLVQKDGGRGQEVARRWISGLVRQHASMQGDPGYLCLGMAIRALRDGANAPKDPLLDLVEQCARTWTKVLIDEAINNRMAMVRRLISLAPDIVAINGSVPSHMLEVLQASLEAD